MSEKEKYEILLDAIEAGGATDETLTALVGAKSAKSLPSQFKYIHVLKKYPVKGDDGVYIITDKDTYAKIKEKGKAPEKAPKLTVKPQEKKENLLKALQAKTISMNKAGEKAKTDCNNDLSIWRNKAAICNFNVARILYVQFKEKVCAELRLTEPEFDAYEDLTKLRDVLQSELDAEFEVSAE